MAIIPMNYEWETPNKLFDELNQEFNFDIDLCANENNTKVDRWYEDYFKEEWYEWNDSHIRIRSGTPIEPGVISNCAFMNPPYDNPYPFVKKAWEDSKHCKIVCLLRCKPSTKWWGIFWDYGKPLYSGSQLTIDCDTLPPIIYRGPKPGCEIRFFPERIQFIIPLTCVLVIMDRREL